MTPSTTDHAPSAVPAPPSPPRPRMPTALIDLIAVGAVGALAFALAAALEFHESFSRWIHPFERYQADELPFTLLILAAGLSWFAFRRWREARAELARRFAAERKVGELLQHNRELAQRLIGVQESERRALARELHDELGQCCNAIRVEAAYIQRCRPEDHGGIVAAAGRVSATAESLYQSVRGMLRRLRPANLDELGLVAALQELCESWEERSGVACVFHSHGDFTHLDDAVSIAVYRVAQEALSNVMRHAQASKVRVALAIDDASAISLRVEDDGAGMPLDRPRLGLGLLGAAERAAALGGRLDIDSSPGAGTRLALELPLADNRQP